VTYYDNAGGARSRGAELSIEARPGWGLVVAAAATWTDAELTQDFPSAAGSARKGDRLPFTSRFAGNVSVDEEFPLAGQMTGFVGASVSYVGERPSAIGSTGPQNYPSYARTDARAGLRSGLWTFNLFANNLTDKRGILNVNPPHGVTYIQPRTIGVSVDRTF
jgi:outer membrane receptor protein involved in Fe transport